MPSSCYTIAPTNAAGPLRSKGLLQVNRDFVKSHLPQWFYSYLHQILLEHAHMKLGRWIEAGKRSRGAVDLLPPILSLSSPWHTPASFQSSTHSIHTLYQLWRPLSLGHHHSWFVPVERLNTMTCCILCLLYNVLRFWNMSFSDTASTQNWDTHYAQELHSPA